MLRNVGFMPSAYDENKWVLKESNGSLAHISFYVDRVLISSKRGFLCLEKLKKVYFLKTNMNFSHYLGMDLLQ